MSKTKLILKLFYKNKEIKTRFSLCGTKKITNQFFKTHVKMVKNMKTKWTVQKGWKIDKNKSFVSRISGCFNLGKVENLIKNYFNWAKLQTSDRCFFSFCRLNMIHDPFIFYFFFLTVHKASFSIKRLKKRKGWQDSF